MGSLLGVLDSFLFSLKVHLKTPVLEELNMSRETCIRPSELMFFIVHRTKF